MSEKTRPGPEQRDRLRRARQAALRKPFPGALSSRLKQPPHRRPETWNGKGPQCPECPPGSFSHCRWDGYRNLWAHPCGYTITAEEIDANTAALEDD